MLLHSNLQRIYTASAQIFQQLSAELYTNEPARQANRARPDVGRTIDRTAVQSLRLRFATWRGGAQYSASRRRGTLVSCVVSSVRQADYWRVKMKWPNSIPRFFGRFNTEAEAERWIAEHRWLTEQREEPDVTTAPAGDPEAPNDR